MGPTFCTGHRIPGPFRRNPNCLQKPSMPPLEMGQPAPSYRR